MCVQYVGTFGEYVYIISHIVLQGLNQAVPGQLVGICFSCNLFSIQIIESEPCQVLLDDALLFAQQFDSCHVLPGQANYPEQSPQLVQPASKALLERGRGASQVRRKEKLKQKKQKKKRNRRK